MQDRFNDLVFAVPTRVYARPLALAQGVPMTPASLELELTFAGYSNDGKGEVAGRWAKQGSRYTIASRGYAGPDGGELPKRVRVTLGRGEVASVVDADSGKPIKLAHLDPARIATLYGAQQEERRIVRLADVPPLLVTGLQAVEDRDFKHHIGLDFGAIARAAFANLRAGHTVQGGSTLTQQLVRNLFLDRNQNFTRKFNEAILSLLIEAHYSKARILQAYINEVFLGQQGSQAVHGFAAAAEFYFGRRLEDLRPQEIALLVGMVKGPSYYDPRRYPKHALQRRNLVLQQFLKTGLITRGAGQCGAGGAAGHRRERPAAAQPLPRLHGAGAQPDHQRLRRRHPARRQPVDLHHARSGRPAVHRAGGDADDEERWASAARRCSRPAWSPMRTPAACWRWSAARFPAIPASIARWMRSGRSAPPSSRSSIWWR